MAASGDPCGREGCGGWLEVYAVRRGTDWQTRYLRCWRCRWKPNPPQQVVRASEVRRRRRRADVST